MVPRAAGLVGVFPSPDDRPRLPLTTENST